MYRSALPGKLEIDFGTSFLCFTLSGAITKRWRSVMLKILLLAGIVVAPLGLAGLVMPAGRDARAVAGRWPAIRRLVLAVAATTALASAAAVSLRLLGAGGQD